jgi:hypothetical protein
VRCPVCGVQPFADEGPCICVAGLDDVLARRVRAALARGVDGVERADVERWLADLRDEQLAAAVDEEKLVLPELGHDRQDVALRP